MPAASDRGFRKLRVSFGPQFAMMQSGSAIPEDLAACGWQCVHLFVNSLWHALSSQ